MLIWRSFLILISSAIISFTGLLVIASGFLPQQTPADPVSDLKIEEKKLSKSFYQIERSLKNEEYDKTAIPKKISDLTSKFEQEYLKSIIKKREENFPSQYNHLSWQLNYVPELFRYYDELVSSAQATGKLNELRDQTARLKSKNPFKVYLTALIENASGNYEGALKTVSGIKNTTKEIQFLKAQALRGSGNYDQALVELTQAEKLSGNDRGFLAKIYNSKGSLFYLSGQIKKADEFYRRALQTARSAFNKEEEAKALINSGIISDEYGDVLSARRSINQALGIINKIQNHDLKAFAYSEMGVSYSLTNEIIEAKDYYDKSYRLFEKMNNRERLAYLSSNLAAIYGQLSNFKAALKHYEEGLNLAGENKRGQILNLTGIGDVYANLANYSKALGFYERAKKLSEEIKDVNSSASVDVSIGTLLYNIGRPHKAIEYYNNAAGIIDIQSNPYNAADLYFKTGLAYTDIDSFHIGVNYFQKGLELAQSSGDIYNEIIITTELSHNYYLDDELQKAEENIDKIRSKTRQYGLTQLGNIQDLYLAKIFIKKNEIARAAVLLNKVINTSTAITDFNTQIEAGYLLARQSELQNNFSDAEKYYSETIKLIDELSRPLFGNQEIQIFRFSSLNEIFASYAELLLNLGKERESFEIIERSRSRNTLQNLNNIKITSAINDESLLNKLYDLDWMIRSGLYEKAEAVKFKKEYDQLRSEIIANDPTLEKYVYNFFDVANNNIKNRLNENEHIITISTGRKFSQVFHISKGKFISRKVELGREELKSMLAEIAPIYQQDPGEEGLYFNQDLFSFNARASFDLYQKLFEPVISEIPKDDLIVFSLPAELAFMPVEFLVMEYDEKGSPYFYDDKKFLVNDHPVAYTPSVSVYLFQKERVLTENNTILLVGDPQFDSKDFALSYRGGLLEDDSFNTRNIILFPLQYSKQEIDNVNSLLNESHVLISDNATESRFKEAAPQSKVIHLSTHSFLYKEQPLIVFSNSEDSEDDGYLESSEILELDLNSELVVLSSCKSGLGKIDKAEGILGMQKSFFEAGAKSVVVSLWDVNDKYTSYFMQSFYKYLSEGSDKAASLQKAKLYFKENYSANPYYWSAFILAGDPSAFELQKASGNNFLIILLILVVISLSIYFIFLRQRKA